MAQNIKQRFYPVHPVRVGGKPAPVSPELLNQHQRLAFDNIYDLQTATSILPRMRYFTLTGAIDGANKLFALPITPKVLQLFRNGIIQDPSSDYKLSANRITMTAAPAPGDKLIATGG